MNYKVNKMIENNTNLTDEQIIEISKYFNCKPEDIEELDYTSYNDLTILDILGDEFIVALDYEEAEEAAAEYIKDTFDEMPTAFSNYVLCDNMPNEISLESVDDLISNELDEVIKELVNIEGLVEDCIGTDGVAHSLASYDGEEIEIGDMLLYRTN